ncbi:UNVERIFIED_CONTAM: hypothetical protein HDU68_009994 [Siphonaria sp. JEL0065]|nr:hypothetical protein HDU68_009994 [Siphonaria sp. JEL0065]
MELVVEIPKYISNPQREAAKAIAAAYDESDLLRGTRFDLFLPKGKTMAILTVPNETAGSFLISAGKWGRLLVGRTELFPRKSKQRPDVNVVKSLLHEQPSQNEPKYSVRSDKEIEPLLEDLQLPEFEAEFDDSDDDAASVSGKSSQMRSKAGVSSKGSSSWTQLSQWTSNMPDVDSDDERVDNISIPVREAWFGVWCDNEAMEYVGVLPKYRLQALKDALLPNAKNFGYSQFKLLPPEERGKPTFSPEWKASQITGDNSFDHPFFEVDGETFKLKLSADVQIRFSEYDIKSVVLHHTMSESSIYITLAHPPIIADTSEITTVSYHDMGNIKYSRLYQVNPKHAFFVFNCLVCRITFSPTRADTIANIFSRVGPSAQSPVLISQGGVYARKHQENLKKILTTLPIRVAYQLSILLSWSIMFPTELLTFAKTRVVPLLSQRSEHEVAQLLSIIVRGARWEPFKGERRPDFSKMLSDVIEKFQYIPEQYDSAKYCFMHALYVTPTGMYLDGPYLDKSNRVIRQYEEYSAHFLHVSFVEEDGSNISRTNFKDIPQDVIYNDRFTAFLKEGIRVAGRLFKFLAFSNSSLKEGRVLFFHEPTNGQVTVDSIRAWMGDFSMIKSPARYAARMGQAFTSTASTVRLSAKEVVIGEPDVVRNGYCFSDGVGTISSQLALEVWKELNPKLHRKNVAVKRNEAVLDLVPSAFQIRFGGAKGMVSVDPSLPGRQMKIRKSMIKFKATNSNIIEVADDSSVCREAYFNRQVILILEDMGVSKLVFLELQRQVVHDLQIIWKNPEKLVDLAAKEGAFANFVHLWKNLGIFEWTANDFIRQSFEHIRSYLLKEIKYKARIKIPGGWTLFGVLDETGALKEGQIFVQLSSPAVSKVVQGPVLIFRSPCIHPGDIQPAIAVDCPRLQHMRNVVVFSQFGKRDLPSKLAGGDLDGDMFTIISDRTFFPKPSAFRAAADYSPSPPLELDTPVTMNDVADFIITYMTKDKLGIIAKRHLYIADQVDGGSNHPECLKLSELHNQAVDFAKSGIPPDFTKVPPVKRRPDFSYAPHNPVKTGYYNSPRVMGLMYRDRDLNYLLEQSYQSGTHYYNQSPDKDPIWKFIKSRSNNWKEYIDAAKIYQFTFECEVDAIASFCRPKLTEIEMWTGYIMEGKSSHRKLYSLEEWVGDQFGALVLKTEKLMVGGRTEEQVVGLAVASYYVSNVVRESDTCGHVFGYLLFHQLAENC